MTTFYKKTKDGNYIPITFTEIITKDWENKLIAVRIGSDENPADEHEIEETMECLRDDDALEMWENISFLTSVYNFSFEIVGTLKEVGEKHIVVRVTGADDLSNLGALQKMAKEQLRGITKKVVFLPTDISVNEYREVNEIKQRISNRRARRSR